MLSSGRCPRGEEIGRQASKAYAEVSGAGENNRQGPTWGLPLVGTVFLLLSFLFFFFLKIKCSEPHFSPGFPFCGPQGGREGGARCTLPRKGWSAQVRVGCHSRVHDSESRCLGQA